MFLCEVITTVWGLETFFLCVPVSAKEDLPHSAPLTNSSSLYCGLPSWSLSFSFCFTVHWQGKRRSWNKESNLAKWMAKKERKKLLWWPPILLSPVPTPPPFQQPPKGWREERIVDFPTLISSFLLPLSPYFQGWKKCLFPPSLFFFLLFFHLDYWSNPSQYINPR